MLGSQKMKIEKSVFKPNNIVLFDMKWHRFEPNIYSSLSSLTLPFSHFSELAPLSLSLSLSLSPLEAIQWV